MWLHRICGVGLAVLGFVAALYLGAILYGSSDPGLHTTVQLGIPGALLATLAAGCALAAGIAFARTPRPSLDRANRAAKAMRAGRVRVRV